MGSPAGRPRSQRRDGRRVVMEPKAPILIASWPSGPATPRQCGASRKPVSRHCAGGCGPEEGAIAPLPPKRLAQTGVMKRGLSSLTREIVAASAERFDRTAEPHQPNSPVSVWVRALPVNGSEVMRPPVCMPQPLSLPSRFPASCAAPPTISSPVNADRSRDHAASHGVIWPEDGCASIA